MTEPAVEHPLEDSFRAVRRAKERFAALEAEAREFFAKNEQNVLMLHNTITGEEIIASQQVLSLPQEWGVTIGEVVHNLRSSLEYLVFALAAKSGGNPDDSRTTFPIARKADGYWGKGKKSYRETSLAGVPDEWRKKIDDLQPFNEGGRQELAALAHLSNSGKHRSGLRVRMRIATPRIAVTVEGADLLKSFEIHFKSWEEGTMKIEARVPRKDVKFVVIEDLFPGEPMGANVAFGPNPPVTSLAMRQIILAVEEILAIFTPAFDDPLQAEAVTAHDDPPVPQTDDLR